MSEGHAGTGSTSGCASRSRSLQYTLLFKGVANAGWLLSKAFGAAKAHSDHKFGTWALTRACCSVPG